MMIYVPFDARNGGALTNVPTVSGFWFYRSDYHRPGQRRLQVKSGKLPLLPMPQAYDDATRELSSNKPYV